MPKNYILLLLFLFSFYASAQENYTIEGKVLNINDQQPLESATVYLTTVKDSTVLDYTLTNKNGEFKFTTKKYDKPVFLKVTYVGFQTFSEEQKNINANKDFSSIYLLESINTLEGVTIKGEDPPIRIKNDTIEFKASLFKVRPDANVEALLKQLPGLEVDSDGKITVNGKEVTQVLVNGKPFFDRDGALALKNLPAEIINKVQVSDFKTKKEEYAKENATSENSSINLTIDEDKNKGYFGKFLGGYGTDDRYESSFVVNFFNNNRKISLLGSSNNINSPGFSMDEVFDNMGGGRNSRGGTTRSQASGITKSNLLGLNYSDELFKNLQTNANYNYSNTTTDNLNKSSSLNFQPTGNFTTNSQSKTQNENTNNKANVELEYKISPSMRLFVAPKFNASNSNNSSESESASRLEDGTLTNESNSKSVNKGESNDFSNAINFNKSFEKKHRNLSLVINNSNNNGNSNGIINSETNYYTTGRNEIRNQNNISNSKNDSYSAEIEYAEPITDSIQFKIGMNYNFQNAINDTKSYNFNALDQTYTDFNDLQSNYITSKQNSISPKAGIRLEKDKFTFDLNSSTSIVQYNNHSDYLNQETDLNKKYVLPNVNGQIRYRMERSKFITAKYNYSLSLPSSTELLPIENVSNPLNTITGNPNLKPTEKQSANLNYRNFDFRTRSGYSIYLNTNFYSNDVISSSIYDADRKRTTTYQNISGTYNLTAGGNWNKSIKKESNLLRYGIALNTNYSVSKGFTDGVLYSGKSIGLTPRVYLNYDYGDFFTIAPSYNFSYNETTYDINSLRSRSNVVHRINLQTTSYWPVNWTWGNDFGYTYNSINQDYYLWNTSLSYSFFDKKFIAKVKVYDVLNQNQSITRNISTTAVSDNENTVLKRYAMFSLTYKIQDFAGMKNPPGAKNDRNTQRREQMD